MSLTWTPAEGNYQVDCFCTVRMADVHVNSYMATGGEDGMVNIFNNVEMQLSRATYISEYVQAATITESTFY